MARLTYWLTMLITAFLMAALLGLAVPAHAKEIARWTETSGYIALFDDKIPSCKGMAVVIYHTPSSGSIPGCWFRAHGFVWFIFADGDTGSAREERFKGLDPT